jgi:hypothetical protein
VESQDELEDRGRLAQRWSRRVRALAGSTMEVVINGTRVVSDLRPLVIVSCDRDAGAGVGHSM